MLPDSDEGLRAPKGPIAEETNVTYLSDGSLYAVYRTIDGFLCHAYSKDNGRTWTAPEYATYAPGARRIKNPRAFSFVRRFSNGKYLLWFHNNGGDAAHTKEWASGASGGYYFNRNPGWVAGGVERNGRIHWSEPEILLYDDDPAVRMSYPDFIETDGRYFITETQKSVARIHELDRTLLEAMWGQFERKEVVRTGLAAESAGSGEIAVPELPERGFALDFDLKVSELTPGQTLFEARDSAGRHIALVTGNHFNLRLTLTDGGSTSAWWSDYGTGPGTLRVDAWQHVSVIVDGGPRLICYVVDGVLNDGGAVRQFGWGRYAKEWKGFGGGRGSVASSVLGSVRNFRIYARPLRVSEAVSNYRAGF
jgi:hypothetical protein